VAQQGPNWSGNTDNTQWPSVIGPILVSVVLPLVKFGVQLLADWFARRATGRLYKAGLMPERRGKYPHTYHSHNRKGD